MQERKRLRNNYSNNLFYVFNFIASRVILLILKLIGTLPIYISIIRYYQD